MNDNKKIAIIGSGVAGMALAILATKLGCKVSLYERNNDISSIGAGVTLWPNAMFVLQQMGVEAQVKDFSGIPYFIRQFDHYGVRQGEFNIDAINSECGFPSATILRRDLMRILAEELTNLGVDIHFNRLITSQDIDDFKQTFDLVVGADGRMNSVVRQNIYPENVMPCYQGFINIIGISQLKHSNLDNAICDYRGAGQRFGIVPIKSDLCFWAGGWRTPINRERPLSAWYREMYQRFQSWPDPIQSVLTCHEKTSLNRIFVHDIEPLPYWHQDNVLIIGDAAHAPLPTSGQGACQALEDAWHLARLLKKPKNLDTILTEFYRTRIAKTSAAQSIGRQLAQQIFNVHAQSQPSVSTMSAKQLSQLWMQGLTTE